MARLVLRSLAFVALSAVLSDCGLAGGPAADHPEATATLVPMGLIQINPSNILSTNPSQPFISGASLYSLGETHFVLTGSPCDGAAGSPLPPLAIMQCSSGLVLGSFWALEDLTGFSGRTLALRGLDRFFVHQEQRNLCWAAAFETARAFLNLQHVSHEDMPKIVSQECPKLSGQTRGAELFQIAYTIEKINHTYDHDKLNPHWCSDERCIINAMGRGRPVIALASSHAVLIQAIEIASGTNNIIRKYYILDPANDGRIEVRHPLEMCTADAFIAL